MSKFDSLKPLKRPARVVALPGGDAVTVRELLLSEIRDVDALAEKLPEGPEREIRRTLLVVGYGLADGTGAPLLDGQPADEDLAALEHAFTPSQLAAIAEGVRKAGDPDDAKNG